LGSPFSEFDQPRTCHPETGHRDKGQRRQIAVKITSHKLGSPRRLRQCSVAHQITILQYFLRAMDHIVFGQTIASSIPGFNRRTFTSQQKNPPR
jgi:hypothetical protein